MRVIAAVAGLIAASPALAAAGAWHFNFQQGTAEYAVGSFGDGGSNVALYCAEAGRDPGSVSIFVHRAGFRPSAPTPATFTTETGKVTVAIDTSDSVSFPSATAPAFRKLWQLVTTGKTLKVAYGPGKPMIFPLTGARAVLGPKVCPKQLAGG